MADQDERVMSAGERAAFAALTVAAVGVVAAFAWTWTPLAWRGAARPLSALVAVAILVHLAVWWSGWLALPAMRRPRPRPPLAGLRVAAVTTIVPDRESIALLEETLRAMIAMRGAHDCWVLDEGDAAEVRALCDRLGARHFSRRGVARYHAPGGTYQTASKHGNYNAWLDARGYAEYDVLVAFDADHVPEPHYLETVLGHFADERVAFVQPPQVYYNQEASLVARGAAEETYAYYSSHLMARYALGNTVVIGSHSSYRMAALRAVGGFPAHDGEDLYLTMLFRARGWRGVYVPDVVAMGITPVDWAGYLAQQLRWARAVLDLKLRVLPRLAGDLPPLERLLNLAHGAFYLRPLLVPVLLLGLVAALVVGVVPGALEPRALLAHAALVAALAAIGAFRQRWYLDPQHERGVAWRAALLQVAKWPAFVAAVRDAVTGRRAAYALTGKSAEGGARRAVVAPTQVGVALLVVAAWGVGTALHGALPLPLTVVASAVVVLALGVAATDLVPSPPAWTPGLHARRRPATSAASATPATAPPPTR
jgi:cellulose synthase (UDP-forming)